MIVIGLTGSIAMGKSEVARIFREEGVPVFDADKEVHDIYGSAEGVGLLSKLVPESIIDGKIDRTRLTRLLLAEPQLLQKLEAVVHKAVAKRRNAFVAAADIKGCAIAVVDAPLLFETGGDTDVNVTVVVSAPAAVQRQRALARPGMTAEKIGMILARQMPDEEKRRRADHIIENDASLETLRERTLAVLSRIRKEHTI